MHIYIYVYIYICVYIHIYIYIYRGAVEFLAPNVAWGLHAPDVPVPKVKVQPPPVEFRKKYFENIEKMIGTQPKIVAYTATLSTYSSEEKDKFSVFPVKILNNGVISYDMVKAEEIPIEEDIRERYTYMNIFVYINVFI
jgi:hypothetical protein